MRKSFHIIALLAALLATYWPANAQSFRFVTTCDAQGNSSSNPDPGASFGYVVSQINTLNPRPDFWIFGGDAYYEATDSANAMTHWQTWLGDIAPITDIPRYAAIGNHDANNYGHFYTSAPWQGDGAGPFKAFWSGLPQNGPTGYQGTAYSFRYGNCIFCVVNTNIYNAASYAATFKVDTTQRTWLSAVLDTTTAAHKFVIGHCEAWPPSDGNGNSSLQWNVSDRDAFWSVMTAHHVEAYICGHIHLWNRDYFVASGYGNAPVNTTTRQVICGGAGGGLVGGYGGNFYHFVVWDIDDASVTARVIDSYGVQRDSFSYTVAAGVAGNPVAAAIPPQRKVWYANGAIRWDGMPGKAAVSVYDIAGRRVWSAETGGNEARCGGAANGVYIVKVAPRGAENAALVGKIVVVR